jgi:amidase
MGSLRNPPGWNGVLGLRPTVGLVPSAPHHPAERESGVDGPISRTVADLHALLATMAGPGRVDPLTLPSVSAKVRMAWLGDLGGYLPFEDGVLEVCREAVGQWCPAAPAVSLPGVASFTSLEQLWPAWQALRHHEVGGWLAAEFDDAEIVAMKPEAQWELEGFRALSSRQLDHARRVRDGVRRSLLSALEHFDVLALPTAQCWPFPSSMHWPTAINGVAMDTYHRWMEVVVPASLLGLPALAVPAGFNAAGLPMGLQIIGAPGQDMAVLQLGQAWHRATDWPGRRPPPV